jgi:hypothetical protein
MFSANEDAKKSVNKDVALPVSLNKIGMEENRNVSKKRSKSALT